MGCHYRSHIARFRQPHAFVGQVENAAEGNLVQPDTSLESVNRLVHLIHIPRGERASHNAVGGRTELQDHIRDACRVECLKHTF